MNLVVSQTYMRETLYLEKLVREIGVEGEYKMFYVSLGWELTDGFRPLKNDRDAIRFINDHKNQVAADFYVESNKELEGLDSRHVIDEEEVVVLDRERTS